MVRPRGSRASFLRGKGRRERLDLAKESGDVRGQAVFAPDGTLCALHKPKLMQEMQMLGDRRLGFAGRFDQDAHDARTQRQAVQDDPANGAADPSKNADDALDLRPVDHLSAPHRLRG